MKWVCADFETRNSQRNINEEWTSVWLWDIYDPLTRNHTNGLDIQSFFKYLFGQKSQIIYFHNLKFDGSFIINALLEYGFEISDTKEDFTISTLITDALVWYTFTVYCFGKRFIFRDSAKKIIGSLKKAAKDFDLPIQKGEIDYMLDRPLDYKPTDEEMVYVHHDTEIMADILQYYYDNGMKAITNASDAMNAYKDIISLTAYNRYFPVLDKEIDDFLRKSYKGGFCWLNPKHKGKDLGKVYTYDVKSMYPSRMHDCMLPCGVPLHYEGKYEYNRLYPLFIQEVQVVCDLKEGHPPSIQLKSYMSLKLKYLETTDGQYQQLVLTNIDLENLFIDYNVWEIHYIQGYMFSATDTLFKKYIDHYFTLKEQSKGAKKQLYKIFLNSLYGKFAMMTERGQALPKSDNGKLRFDRPPKQIVDATYTAVASFITAYARQHLLKGIRANIENYIYCDTDSIHLLQPAHDIDEGNNLGQFAIENGHYEIVDYHGIQKKIPVTHISKARYLGQKCYILLSTKDGKDYEIKKIAGAPDKAKEGINLDNFREQLSTNPLYNPKFRQKNVKGGVILIPIPFTIRPK